MSAETICLMVLCIVAVCVYFLIVGIFLLIIMDVDISTVLKERAERRHERKMLKISKKYEHDKAKKLDASKPKMF